MDNSAEDRTHGRTVEEKFTQEQDRSLSEAVLDAIQRYQGDEAPMTDFVLYDDIDPDALDRLFRSSTRPQTAVSFSTDGVRVELWGDGGVEIRVRDRPE